MRSPLQMLLFATIFSFSVYAKELVPGILSFDPPSFLKSLEHGTEYTEYAPEVFIGVVPVKQYFATNSSNPSCQRIDIRLRFIGATLGQGKVWTYRKLDDKALRAELLALLRSNGMTNAPVADVKLGGQTALEFPFTGRPRPDAPVIYGEFYWIRCESNRVVEVLLRADSTELLRSLRESLSKLKVVKKHA